MKLLYLYCGETSGDIAKCWLFSQSKESIPSLQFKWKQPDLFKSFKIALAINKIDKSYEQNMVALNAEKLGYLNVLK